MARGADFGNREYNKTCKGYDTTFGAAFVNAFRRADELATAMEVRCTTAAITVQNERNAYD